jgi:hypothetical protein
VKLAPGESVRITEQSILSRCARCLLTFITRPRSVGDVAAPPTRCGKCKSRYFNVPRMQRSKRCLIRLKAEEGR